MFTEKEIRETINNRLDISTARGRNRIEKREIDLRPAQHEIDYATRARADGYVEMARELAERVKAHRHGIGEDELERVELVREELFSLAKDLYVELIQRG